MDEVERQAKMAYLARCKEEAEKAYDAMYDAHSYRDANDCYREAKDYFYAAIGHADDIGLPDEVEALRKRLEHVRAVFRSQFAQ
jgi:hypothetical protein